MQNSNPHKCNKKGAIKPSGDIEDMYSHFEKNEDQLKQGLCLKIKTEKLHVNQLCNPFRKEDMLAIPGHFPNLKKLTLNNNRWGYGPDSTYEDSVDQEIAKQWTGITKFKERNEYFLSTALLKNSGFVNLRKLDVDFLRHEYDEFEIRPETEPRKLIMQLSNAPHLKTLKLRNGRMTLTDWENIACNAPRLEVLRFDDMIIDGPYSQKSTTSELKKFHASNCSERSNKIILLSLVDKYKTLETLKIRRVKNEEYDVPGSKQHFKCLLDIIASQNPALKTYVIDIFPESDEWKRFPCRDSSVCEKILRKAIESLKALPEYEPNSMDGVRRTLFNKSDA